MPCPPLPWLRLLAVLLVVAGCGASQQQQQQQQQPEPYGDWLEALISQAVTTATEPLLRPLADRLERLDSQLDVLATRLDNQDHKLDGLAIRLNNQDAKLDGLAIKLENCNSELSNHSAKLEGLMVRLDNQDFKMDGLAAKLSNQESKLDEIRNGLTTSHSSQDSKLSGLVTTLSNQDAELNGLVSNLSSQDSKLNGIVATLSNQHAELNRLIYNLSSQDAKLNGLVTTLSNQDAELNGLASSLSSQDTKLNGLGTQINEVYTNVSTRAPLPRDCSDLPAGSRSGVYQLQLGLNFSQPPVKAFCDLDHDGGGWTVIQRRADVQPRQNFFRDWAAYKEGFGELDAEFWWGLERLWLVTSARDRQYELRINLGDFDEAKRYAVYRSFSISSESDGYRLLAKNYTGNAGDSMGNNDGQMFSTKDKDRDQSSYNCAADRQGGWWYNSCTAANLNGPYLSGESPGQDVISWYAWRGRHYSLKTVEMKIRPT